MDRYSGGCEELCDVDVTDLVTWINAIAPEDWPNWVKHPEHKGNFRPCVNDQCDWQDMESHTNAVVAEVLSHFPPGCYDKARAITTVLPGDYVPAHTDMHPSNWVVRVHVPITTNTRAQFLSCGKWTNMKVGKAYLVNTESPHAISNTGDTNRVHLMFDVMSRFSGGTRIL